MKILILEDNDDRIAAFRTACAALAGYELIVWSSATEMIADLPNHIMSAALISLDHDLVSGVSNPDPGDGLQVARALAGYRPACTVILHSTNVNRVHSMARELEDRGWSTARVGPVGMGADWIPLLWVPKVRQILKA